jgi:hypothetical protein
MVNDSVRTKFSARGVTAFSAMSKACRQRGSAGAGGLAFPGGPDCPFAG